MLVLMAKLKLTLFSYANFFYLFFLNWGQTFYYEMAHQLPPTRFNKLMKVIPR